ncbi:MAG TPA: ATP-binding protein [Burkholderiales bacterium]|nr:ATP-binding protein [Burkholderiales bacterium]
MSQRARLLAIVAVAVLPLVALSALDIVGELRDNERRVTEERVQAARLLAFSVESFIDGNLSAMRAMTLHPAIAAGRRSPELEALLKRVAADNPQWSELAVIDGDGTSIAGSLGRDPVYLGDRPYFQEAIATGRPVLGDALIGRLSGKPAVVLALPYSARDGRRLVLLAPLPTDRFRAGLVRKLAAAPAQLVVLDREGHAVIGGAAPDGGLAREHGPEVDAVLAGAAGSEIVPRDAGPALVAYAPVGEYGFGALISQPAASAFAAVRREAWQRGAVLSAIVLTIGALAWALGGRLSQLYQRALDARGEAERLAGELRHALTTRDDFLASAAHDLRNPLSAIRGAADLVERTLERGELPRERLEASIAHIQSASRRISGMLDAFLDLAQLQLGRPLELRKELQDVAALVREALAQAQQASARHRLRLAAPAELMAVVDGARLQRVIDNLLANALKYSPDGGEIAVELREEGSELALGVRDPGIGIPPSEVEAVFERFRRGSNVAGRFTGTGIGLAGVRQIVEQHGGSVHVTSTLGRGSTFTVRLPTGRP